MVRIPPEENNSQFCITFTNMEQLDYKNVVFGKIIKGNKILNKIEGYARKIGKPYADIIISNCGEIDLATSCLGKFRLNTTMVGSNDRSGASGCRCLRICQCHQLNEATFL